MNLDIIIPSYNSIKTIDRCLFSIAIQKDTTNINVYIINDKSDYDYSKQINFFNKYFPVTELKLDKNKGPGFARQYGIDNSYSDYIMFMDSDDFFYSPYSLKIIFEELNNDYDMLVSNFIYQRDNEIKEIKNNYTWLHGKIFKRKFLNDNKIRFNNTRANEDNGFIRLCLFHLPMIKIIDKFTYVYSENKNSITRKSNRKYKYTGLKWLTYNYNWAMNIALKKNLNQELVFDTATNLLVAMYFYYLDLHNDYDVDKIFSWCVEIKYIYDKLKEKYDDKTNFYIDTKQKEYKNINYIISFKEFLNRIEEKL